MSAVTPAAVCDFPVGATFSGQPRRLSRTDFVRYAGISGDFNPLHHDEIRAQAAGEPSVFGHGMFAAGLLATDLADLFGLANLLSYRVRFTRQSRPDDILTSVITVLARRDEETVELDCVLRTADGAVVVQGSARAAIPAGQT